MDGSIRLRDLKWSGHCFYRDAIPRSLLRQDGDYDEVDNCQVDSYCYLHFVLVVALRNLSNMRCTK